MYQVKSWQQLASELDTLIKEVGNPTEGTDIEDDKIVFDVAWED